MTKARWGRLSLDGRLAIALVATLIAILRASCGFTGHGTNCPNGKLSTPQCVYSSLAHSPLATGTEGDLKPVLDERDGLKIQHGHACGKGSRSLAANNEDLGTRLQKAVPIPPNYDATVFLNGWSAEYTSTDHHILGIAATLFDIKVDDQKHELSWSATGALGDNNGDDPYWWCYRYTTLAWPRSSKKFVINAKHSTVDQPLIFMAAKEAKPASALRTIDGSSARTSTKRERVPLLAGFGTIWTGGDHHLLQLGFDAGLDGISGTGDTLAWRARSILKDNAVNYDSNAAEVVSILGGASVKLWQPAEVTKTIRKRSLLRPNEPPTIETIKVANKVALEPRGTSACVGSTIHDYHSVEYTIPDVPFAYAVPMLTGWDVGDSCDDNHVRRVGAWIRDFRTEKDATTGKKVLRYTVEGGFADQDFKPNDFVRFQVAVLGIDGARPVDSVRLETGNLAVLDPGTTGPAPTPVVPTCNGRPATIVGTAGDETINGTGGPDVIVGLGGRDEIKAGGGDDVVCGNEGDDTIDGASGIDFCDGGFGSNTLKNCE